MSRTRVLLGDALSTLIDHRGKTPKKLGGDWSLTGHRVVSAININDSQVDNNDHHYVRSDVYARWMKEPLRAGDVLLTSEAPTGEAAYLAKDTDWVLGQRLFGLRGKPGLLDGRYLYYSLRGGDVRHQLMSRTTGTTVAGIRQSELVKVELELPPIEAQRGIAATLGALDDKIESNRRAQALIEQLVQARFDAAFSVDDDPDGEPISSLVTVNPRRTLGRGQLATYVGMSSLPEHAAEVMDWDVKEFGSGQKFVNGDVLMARITPCLENGKTAVVDMLHGDEVGWGSTEYIVLTPRGDVSTPWIYCLVRSELVRAYAIRSMTGTSGRQRFQPDGFDKYRVSAPERRALQAFNAEAMPLFARMTALRDENRALAKVRDALLPELLSGRVRVPEAAKAAEGLA